MAKRFDPDKLSQRLAPFGFALNLPETHKAGISFIRPSTIARLHEHILIRTGRVAYAEAVISGATFTSCHPCVSETDERFRAFLSDGAWYRTSGLETWAAAQSWQQRLVENAEAYCKAMAAERGPQLAQRLLPVFAAVDSYVQRFGDLLSIFDREAAFVSEASPEEQAEVERLANLARSMLYLNSEDGRLASIALVRFGKEVEGSPSPFRSKVPHRDAGLAARLILLTDYVHAKRLEYEMVGGLHR
jgi:hypothetical protein